MNAEYQRLEAEASEVQNPIDGLVSSCSQMVAADFQKFEARIAVLHQRLAGLRQGMVAAETRRVRDNAGTGGEAGKISAEDVSFSGNTPQNSATDRRSHGGVECEGGFEGSVHCRRCQMPCSVLFAATNTVESSAVIDQIAGADDGADTTADRLLARGGVPRQTRG